MLSVVERRSYSVLRHCCIGTTNVPPDNWHCLHGAAGETVVKWINTSFKGCGINHIAIPVRNMNRTMVVVTQTRSIEENMASTVTTSSSNKSNFPLSEVNPPQQSENQSVIVTDACYQRIKYLITQKMKQQNDDKTASTSNDSSQLFLRVFVDAGGCSGFTYQFELDNDNNLNPEEDVVFTESVSSINNPSGDSSSQKSSLMPAARVVIDRGSLNLINGSTIDYVQEMIKSTFEVRDNPQSESACGCGSSFALKNFASNPAID